MERERRIDTYLRILSLSSAWSLILFGCLCLLGSLFSVSIPGILIGVALLVHGTTELYLYRRLLQTELAKFASALARNQIALAASVVVYLLWQANHIDAAEIIAVLDGERIAPILAAFKPDIRETLREDLPVFLTGFYLLAAILVVMGCLGMGTIYFRYGKRLER